MMIMGHDFLFLSSLLLKATFESTAGQFSLSHLADGKTGMHLAFNLLIWFLTCFVRHIFEAVLLDLLSLKLNHQVAPIILLIKHTLHVGGLD